MNPQGTVVGLPHNSPLMKFAIRTDSIPKPGITAMKSNMSEIRRPRHTSKDRFG